MGPHPKGTFGGAFFRLDLQNCDGFPVALSHQPQKHSFFTQNVHSKTMSVVFCLTAWRHLLPGVFTGWCKASADLGELCYFTT